MTSPDGYIPTGAYGANTVASMQGLTQKDVANSVNADMSNKLQSVGGAYNNGVKDPLAQFEDTQLTLNDRVDLLNGVAGYCSSFMSKNWRTKGGTRITLPFDSQLGPNKDATLYAGKGIKFGTKGLWRADAHVSFYPAPSGWFTSGSVSLSLWIVVAAVTNGAVYSERQYDIVVSRNGSETAAFSHTFVLPDPSVSGTEYAVYVQSRHEKDWHWVYGGTVRSALSVNKWDLGTNNNNVLPTAPDGGDLTE